MSLDSKLANPLLLSAAVLTLLSGCTTVRPWEYDRTESQQINSRIITQYAGTKIAKEKSFNISNFSLVENEYQAKVTESLKESTFNIIKSREDRQIADITFEKQIKTTNVFLPAFIAISGAGLLVAATYQTDDPNNIFSFDNILIAGTGEIGRAHV